MFDLPDCERIKCADAIAHNVTILNWFRGAEDCSTIDTMNEMECVARIPYDPLNRGHKGDTLDRYSWSAYGNSAETSCLTTLCVVKDRLVDSYAFARSKEDQVDRKIDIHDLIDGVGIQCKPIEYGSPYPGHEGHTHRDIFVSLADLSGDAQFVANVCAITRRLILIDKKLLLRRYSLHTKDDDKFPAVPHRHYDTRIKQGYAVDRCVGHYISPSMLRIVGTIMPIPDGIMCVIWDDDSRQMLTRVYSHTGEFK